MSAKYDMTVKNLERQNHRTLHAGDDYDHAFAVTRGGLALSLVGGKVWFTIKEDPQVGDADALLQYDSETPGGSPNVEITSAIDGEFTIHFRDTDTANLEGRWPYDIKARLGGVGAPIIRLARGVIEFLPNLTREIA